MRVTKKRGLGEPDTKMLSKEEIEKIEKKKKEEEKTKNDK